MGEQYSLPFTYIWDRCDSLKDGSEVEVTDYKTVAMPVSPEELRSRIQPRAYALAAQIRFPDAERIWVTYDLLRYDKVGVVFTRAENVATWRYLQQMAVRIRESDGTKETLNAECRWCVRKSACETLHKHASNGGILGIQDIQVAIDLRAKNDAVLAALKTYQAELDEFILDYMMQEDTTEIESPSTIATASIRSQRKVNSFCRGCTPASLRSCHGTPRLA